MHFFCESKLNKNRDDALSACIKSVLDFATQKRDFEVSIINNHLDIENPELREAIISFLDPSKEKDENWVEVFACFIGFNWSKFAEIEKESVNDTLVNANKQDWSNYTDILRCSFENETCTLYRKKAGLTEIDNVKFSLAISGTPGQFKTLMGSSENGLFSRGCYYIFENTCETLKCFGRLNITEDVDEFFANYANLAKSHVELVMSFDNINVGFSREQLTIIQSNLQTEYEDIYGITNLHANIKRNFVITQKIATILECLFKCENNQLHSSISCSTNALEIAIALTKVFIKHSYKAFSLLAKEKTTNMNVDEVRFHSKLPKNVFSREQAIQIGKVVCIKERTCDNMLKDLVKKGMLLKCGHGKYKVTA